MEIPLRRPAILVLIQMPDAASAKTLARAFVEQRLAACVSIGAPVSSLYHWKGQIETADEVPMVVKTVRDNYPAIEAVVRTSHPYEVPEILAVPVVDGLPAYLDWIDTETRRPPTVGHA